MQYLYTISMIAALCKYWPIIVIKNILINWRKVTNYFYNEYLFMKCAISNTPAHIYFCIIILLWLGTKR